MTERDQGHGGRARAIVTFSRSWQALTAVRSLGRHGVEVMTGDEVAFTPGSLSRYSVDSFRYPSPEEDPEGFLDALDEAVDRFRPPRDRPFALLPVHREGYVIAERRQRFEGRIALALPEAAAIERVRDKGCLAALASRAGVAMPRTWLPESVDEVARVAREARFPVFVKQRRGVGGVGVERADVAEALPEVFERIASRLAPRDPPPIVQENVAGKDHCVCALFERGSPRAVLTYRVDRRFGDNGPGVVRETVSAPRAEEATVRLLENLDWHGVAEADFRWTGEADREPLLIEVNPRMFSGLFQAVASGIDFPWLLYELAVGGSPATPKGPDLEVRTETPVLGLLATLRDVAAEAGPWHELGEAWQRAKDGVSDGSGVGILAEVAAEIGRDLDLDRRRELLERAVEERQTVISELFADDDPQAAIGLLYPLAALLSGGSLKTESLVGAKAIKRRPGGSRRSRASRAADVSER